tara:strand:- start:53 stop:175 length:123 start_codon:yes stop_codon:yes gene_type:complete
LAWALPKMGVPNIVEYRLEKGRRERAIKWHGRSVRLWIKE